VVRRETDGRRLACAGPWASLLTENTQSGLYAWLAGQVRVCNRFFWQTYMLSSWQNPHSAWGVAGLKRPRMVPLLPWCTAFRNARRSKASKGRQCPGHGPAARIMHRERAPGVPVWDSTR